MNILFVTSKRDDTERWFQEVSKMAAGQALTPAKSIRMGDNTAHFRTIGSLKDCDQLMGMEFGLVVRHYFFLPKQESQCMAYIQSRIRTI